jgi:two-component system chemotaxis response regulator CheY
MKQSILIIEKNVAIRYLLTTVLRERYKTIAHPDCYHAVNDLKNKTIELVIVNIEDQNTPNFDFLLHLNSSSFYSNIPVIVVSDNVSTEFRLKCLELGVEAFFLKPFDPLQLLECINVITAMSENMRRMNEDITPELTYKMSIST